MDKYFVMWEMLDNYWVPFEEDTYHDEFQLRWFDFPEDAMDAANKNLNKDIRFKVFSLKNNIGADFVVGEM